MWTGAHCLLTARWREPDLRSSLVGSNAVSGLAKRCGIEDDAQRFYPAVADREPSAAEYWCIWPSGQSKIVLAGNLVALYETLHYDLLGAKARHGVEIGIGPIDWRTEHANKM